MKKLGIIAAILIVGGILLVGLSYLLTGGDVSKYNSKSGNFSAKEYKCSNSITELEIEERSGGIVIKSADVSKPEITYSESDNEKYEIVENGSTLSIKKKTTENRWGIFIGFEEKELTVLLPKNYDGTVDVKCTSGSISIEELTAESVKIKNTSGSITLSEVVSNGDISASNSSGSIKFENVIGMNVSVSNTSGSIKLDNLVADGKVDVDGTSGSIRFDRLASTGDINIKNTSGSIKGTIIGKESDFEIDAHATSGSCNLSDSNSGAQKLNLKTTSGGISVEFEEN